MTLYRLIRRFGRRVYRKTLAVRFSGRERIPAAGGFILACLHASHMDPVSASVLFPREIRWMARVEFYRRWWSSALLRSVGAFPVNRAGVPVGAIKRSIRLAADGEVVGIFPEGEVERGPGSVLFGGRIRRGVCLIAMRAGVPVVPCVLLGGKALLRFGNYSMFRKRPVWFGVGEPIPPPREGGNRKAARESMALEIERSLRALAREVRGRG